MENLPTHAPEDYDCPFCRLVRGELTPGSLNATDDIVLQTDRMTAFVSPVWWSRNPGHVLVVPNAHYENLYSIPVGVLYAVQAVSQRVAFAMKATYGFAGVSTRQHNEPAGNQDVWHFHQHVFPRYDNDDLYRNKEKHVASPEERLHYAGFLRDALAGQSYPAPNLCLVVFRSRIDPEHAEEYGAMASEIAALAKAQPGILAFKTFTASDGERVTLAEFESEEAVNVWREHSRHKDAQHAGRDRFYSEYRLQVCDVLRDYGFNR
ncbi:MAG: HIT domain-containing protein, partial [Akkermansiaceae bacterium]|nr:HIT domain-containing protein [Armatimonadota bacterium]